MKVIKQLGLMALCAMWPAAGALAQSDPLDPVPGGGTAQTAVCIQFGDLNSGAFVSTLWKSQGGHWLGKGSTSARAPNQFEQIERDDDVIELHQKNGRQLSYRIDFERKKIKSSRADSDKGWSDAYHLLSATDEESAADCIALASRSAAIGGQGGDAAKPRQNGGTTVVFVTIKPGSPILVKPGTKLTATSGPPCPNQPGFFLCPNKFSCAPDGGVCCPGAGACGAGTFCDRFVPNSCISPASPSFCQGTGNPATGVSLHCAPGSTCLPGNFCDP